MRFLAVCSFGVGSSLILKLTLDKAMAKLGVEGEALNIDLSSARGTPCDAVFIPADRGGAERGDARSGVRDQAVYGRRRGDGGGTEISG
jgi:PTS system ascorbate-specific IIB component